MFIACDHCCLMELFTMPTAVVFSQCIGVGGYGCPSSFSARHMILASSALRKRAPSSASAADAATQLRIVAFVRTAPLRPMGHPSFGSNHKKK